MNRTTSLSRPIIESLYAEALVLADEVRAVFAVGLGNIPPDTDDRLRLILSTEGLKTTTRMMHVLAWLLNQRAYFSGQMSERQLREHGALPEDRDSEDEELALLEPETRELIAETRRLHRRVARLDAAWRDGFDARPAVRDLHERIDRALCYS